MGTASTLMASIPARSGCWQAQPQHDEGHEHRADGLGAQHEPPAGLADGCGRRRDERPEHADDADVDGVGQPEDEHDDPEPLARGVNSLQPSRSSRTIEWRGAPRLLRAAWQADAGQADDGDGIGQASTASAQPGPTPTTSRPATAGPMMASPLRLKDSSALACWSRVAVDDERDDAHHRRHGERRHGAVDRPR